MDKDKYVFIPIAGPPTVKKLQKITLILIGLMTIGCGAVALFSKLTSIGLILISFTYIILCLFVIAARFTITYIVDIQIDPVEGLLYSSFITHNGKMGMTKINIKQAKYSYKLQTTRDYAGYILTIKDNNSTLQIRETKSKNKDLTNVFLRSQLDEMNQIILQIKAE